MSIFTGSLGAKRLQILRELVPAQTHSQSSLIPRSPRTSPSDSGGVSNKNVGHLNGKARNLPMAKPYVIFIGVLPPSMSGQARINSEIIALLSSLCQLIVVDTFGGKFQRNLQYHLRRTKALLRSASALVLHARSGGILYLSADDGLGIVYHIVLSSLARLCGYRIFVHYHSFACIDEYSRLTATLLTLCGPRATYIFLCEVMRERFWKRYNTKGNAVVLSNMYFTPLHPPRETSACKTLKIGLMSRLTYEKGLHEFLSLIRAASGAALPVKGILAGPVSVEADLDLIRRVQDELGSVLDFRGPLHGEQTHEFYSEIDVFMFPTRYKVEAQPLVLLDAVAHGVPVITWGRGCIGHELFPPSVVIVPPSASFSELALAQLKDWLSDQAEFQRARSAARQLALQLKQKAEGDAQSFLSALFPNRAV